MRVIFFDFYTVKYGERIPLNMSTSFISNFSKMQNCGKTRKCMILTTVSI